MRNKTNILKGNVIVITTKTSLKIHENGSANAIDLDAPRKIQAHE